MYVYKKKKKISAYTDDALPGDIYLPVGQTFGMGHHVTSLEFSLPNSEHLPNLIGPKDNLLNETTTEVVDLFSKDTFKLPEELLVKTAIHTYTKKLTASFVNESYFLYDRSNLTEPTFITEISKLISIYGSIIYFDRRSVDEIVKVVSFDKPMEFSVIKDVAKNPLESKLTKIHGTIPRLNDGKYIIFLLTEVERKSAAMSNPIETVIVRVQQKFDLYDVLNPAQIQINGDRILRTLKKHKNIYYKLTHIGILFPSPETNSTEQIFITCRVLNDAKVALLNGKIYNILGIINLIKINNCDIYKRNRCG